MTAFQKLLRPFLRLPRWVLSVVCVGLILYLTLVPKPLPENDIAFWEHTDKLVHAIMFGALYTCLYLDIWRGYRPRRFKALLLTLPVIAMGGIIEILQHAMALGRGGDWLDFAADTLGTFVAMLLL